MAAVGRAIGLMAHQLKGMDCRRLRKDYDIFGYLPPYHERHETHLGGGICLAAVSMVTGWEMDPTVGRAEKSCIFPCRMVLSPKT